jgi:hypothetical protein
MWLYFTSNVSVVTKCAYKSSDGYAGSSVSLTSLTPPSQAQYDIDTPHVSLVRTLNFHTPSGQGTIRAPVLKVPALPEDMCGLYPTLPTPYLQFPSNPLFCADPDDALTASPALALSSHPVDLQESPVPSHPSTHMAAEPLQVPTAVPTTGNIPADEQRTVLKSGASGATVSLIPTRRNLASTASAPACLVLSTTESSHACNGLPCTNQLAPSAKSQSLPEGALLHA